MTEWHGSSDLGDKDRFCKSYDRRALGGWAPDFNSVVLGNMHHAYAKTDGTYDWPNSREGDMLRQSKREIEELISLLKAKGEKQMSYYPENYPDHEDDDDNDDNVDTEADWEAEDDDDIDESK